MAYECQKLKIDLEHLDKQVAVNQNSFPAWARSSAGERLAQRQMKFIRSGTKVLDWRRDICRERNRIFAGEHRAAAAVATAGASQRKDGRAIRDPKVRLYVIGTGMMLIACGLVLGRRGARKSKLRKAKRFSLYGPRPELFSSLVSELFSDLSASQRNFGEQLQMQRVSSLTIHPGRRFGLLDLTKAPAMAVLLQRNCRGSQGIELWAARTGLRHE